VAIEQHAAARREHDALGALRLRLFRPAATLSDLHLRRASDEQGEPNEHRAFDDLQAHGGLRHR